MTTHAQIPTTRAVTLLTIFIALAILSRSLCFLSVNLKFIDTDQPLLWLGAWDFSQGRFPEPRFYGQDYNTFLESLLAAPLLWTGMPVYAAVPLATHLMSLFPFLFVGAYLFAAGRHFHALLAIGLLACMPAEYDMLNSLPRGFVTGLFFCPLFVISLLRPQQPAFIFINTVLATLGYFVNPNSLLVTAPLLFYLMLCNLRAKRFYLITAAGLLSAVPLYFLFDDFYRVHPEHVILPLHNAFDPSGFFSRLANLPQAIAHVSPFGGRFPWGLPALLLIISAVCYRTNRRALAAIGVFVLIMVSSCLWEKSAEGSDWVFYSFGRIYLGAPLFVVMMIALLPMPTLTVARWLPLIPAAFGLLKFASFESTLLNQLDKSKEVCVALMPLDEALQVARFYGNVCDNHATDRLVVSGRFWLATVVAYAGPAAIQKYPRTLVTNGDRRIREKEAARKDTPERFVLLSSSSSLEHSLSGPFELRRLDDYGLYLVTRNGLTLHEFCKLVIQAEEHSRVASVQSGVNYQSAIRPS